MWRTSTFTFVELLKYSLSESETPNGRRSAAAGHPTLGGARASCTNPRNRLVQTSLTRRKASENVLDKRLYVVGTNHKAGSRWA